VSFDDTNLLGYGGLVPVVRLAERCGLSQLAGRQILRIVGAANSGGPNTAAKLVSLVAAMCAGADSIVDADRLRHGADAPGQGRRGTRHRAGISGDGKR